MQKNKIADDYVASCTSSMVHWCHDLDSPKMVRKLQDGEFFPPDGASHTLASGQSNPCSSDQYLPPRVAASVNAATGGFGLFAQVIRGFDGEGHRYRKFKRN